MGGSVDLPTAEFSIAFSILLLAVSLGLLFRWIEGGSIFWMLFSIPVMVWSFGSYQTNLQLYIAAGAAALFLYKENDIKRLFFVCLKVVLPFLGAFAINQFFAGVVFSSSSVYLTSQFRWGKSSIEECLNNILTYFKQVFGPFSFIFL